MMKNHPAKAYYNPKKRLYPQNGQYQAKRGGGGPPPSKRIKS